MTADAVGGVWTYAMELCSALSQHDVEVVLAVLGPAPTDPQRNRALALRNVRLEVAQYKLEWMHEPWTDVAEAGEWLMRLADRENVQLVHLNGFVHATLPWREPVLIVAHSCVYSWWQAVHLSQPPSSWQIYHDRVQTGLRHADTVVAPTKAFLSTLQEQYSFAAPTRVIHNGIESEHLRQATVHPKDPIIFASGRLWDEAKNIGALDIAARGLPWRIDVAGDATSPEDKQRQLDHVRCVGSRTCAEITQHLGRASIFIHPALYEPFGLSVLEAAHAGCALVLSNIPTLRELWSEAALFVDPRDPRSIHDALHSLIADTPRRERLGRLALDRAAHFSAKRMAIGYWDIYQRLAERKSLERSVA